MFHNDTDGAYQAKLGWSIGPNNKQVLASKIPPLAVDTVNKKVSPAKRPFKASLFFVGKPDSTEAAFLKTINHTNKIDAELSMFKGEFWQPKREAEDALEQSRVRLQRVSNTMMGSQAISDIAEQAVLTTSSNPEPALRDLLIRMKALSDENVRLLEPSLSTAMNDYTFKKNQVRSQMIKGLEPARLREPLLQAPVFSEDLNIFPSSVLRATMIWRCTLKRRWFFPKKPTVQSAIRSHSNSLYQLKQVKIVL